MPRVTVILSTYNWATVLPYSIGSVQDQTFTDWELLVVGDGCTDDSAEVVTRIADPRVRWVDLRPGTGHQSGPNNEGLRQAAGDVVAYLGHDDLWFPEHLSRAVKAIDDGADVVHAMGLQIDPSGRLLPPLIETRAGWMPPSCVVHRKAVTDAVGDWRDFRDLSVGPELDLWHRMAAAGYRKALVPRLGVVKFPGSLRRDVYLERPCDEQAAWLARMRDEPDLEATELGRLVVSLDRQTRWLSAGRRLGRLLTEPSQWRAFVWRRGGARIIARQKFKGATAARARDPGNIGGGRNGA